MIKKAILPVRLDLIFMHPRCRIHAFFFIYKNYFSVSTVRVLSKLLLDF